MPLGITFRDFHQVIKAIKEAEMEICPSLQDSLMRTQGPERDDSVISWRKVFLPWRQDKVNTSFRLLALLFVKDVLNWFPF